MTAHGEGQAAPTPYGELRVVELTADPAGELTGLHFARQGAAVTKIEPPGGVPSRHHGPWAGDEPDPEASLAFWYYNGGKRSRVLDLGVAGGMSAFRSLLADADVLICSLHPRVLRELSVDLRELSDAYPSLIVVSITPFGLTGPWSDYLGSDLVSLAASGLLWTSGYDDHSIPPIRPGGDQAFHTASSFAQIAATLALIERQRSGRGGLVDVSIHDSCGVTVELANPYWFYPRGIVQRQTCRHAQPVRTQSALFACLDGAYVYFALVLSDAKAWGLLVGWLQSHGLAADLGDAAYDSLAHRQAQFSHVQGVLESFFALMPAATAYHEGQANGLAIGALLAPEDLLVDEHLKARGFFVPVEYPGYGEVVFPDIPFHYSAYDRVPMTRAPRLGEEAPS